MAMNKQIDSNVIYIMSVTQKVNKKGGDSRIEVCL